MVDDREVQLTPEARAAEEKWKADHPAGECPCWKCMHAKMPWVEQFDEAQREIERLENEVYSLRDAYELKANRGGRQLGQ